jgi:hypothetical protein
MNAPWLAGIAVIPDSSVIADFCHPGLDLIHALFGRAMTGDPSDQSGAAMFKRQKENGKFLVR